MLQIPGIRAEYCRITPICRRKGNEEAWRQAVDRLKAAYDGVIDKRGDADECDFNLVLTLETPHTKAKAQDQASGD